jgi:hypothetical protein
LRDALGKARGPHPAADVNVHGVSTASQHGVESLTLQHY